jgi:hypothetical protein
MMKKFVSVTARGGWLSLTAINESNRIERSTFVNVVVGWIHSQWSDLERSGSCMTKCLCFNQDGLGWSLVIAFLFLILSVQQLKCMSWTDQIVMDDSI